MDVEKCGLCGAEDVVLDDQGLSRCGSCGEACSDVQASVYDGLNLIDIIKLSWEKDWTVITKKEFDKLPPEDQARRKGIMLVLAVIFVSFMSFLFTSDSVTASDGLKFCQEELEYRADNHRLPVEVDYKSPTRSEITMVREGVYVGINAGEFIAKRLGETGGRVNYYCEVEIYAKDDTHKVTKFEAKKQY
jgi:hypothetical protein